MWKKNIDVQHIDFNFGEAYNAVHGTLFKHINIEFELYTWVCVGNPRLMVAKLKQLTIAVMQVRMLRDSIECISEKCQTCLFDMERGVPYILYLENRTSEKMVIVILLEGLHHRTTGAGDRVYFKELETHLNDGILAEKNGN